LFPRVDAHTFILSTRETVGRGKGKAMHNLYELYLLGREKHSEAIRYSLKPSVMRANVSHAAPDSVLWMGRTAPHAALILRRGEVMALRRGRQPTIVTCVTGRAWVTTGRDRKDYLLEPGMSLRVIDRGKLLVQALRTATIGLESPRNETVTVTIRPRMHLQTA
jgi:hypothetical protein